MIKTIIFDFDMTMYVGDVGSVRGYERRLIEDCFDCETYKYLNEKYNICKKDIKDIVDFCHVEKLDYVKLAKAFENNVFQHINCEKVKVLPNEFFAKLKANHSLYIASMSQDKYLSHYLNFYGFDKSNFAGILSLDLINDDNKKMYIKESWKEKKTDRKKC